MAYINVVVDEPTDSPLTYRLTPETLLGAKPGVLVEVPFGSKMTTGIVLDYARTVTSELKDKIRPISRILSPGPWAPPATLRLARALMRYSTEPVGVCLFRLLPPSGKRSNHDVRPSKRTDKGRMLHAYGGHETRLSQYVQLITKAVAAGQQTILIAPLARHEWLKTELTNIRHPESEASALRVQDLVRTTNEMPKQVRHDAQIAPFRIATVSAELAPGKQRAIAHDLASGLIDVLIGTRHVVGWPAYALGLQIVDDPYHQSHEDEQRPYLDATTIALTRASVEGGHVVLGSSLPSPALVAREQKGIAQRLHVREHSGSELGNKHFASERERATPTFLQSAAGQLIHPTILEAVRNALQDGHRAALIAPRHGVGGSTACLDCGFQFQCTACGGELETSSNVWRCYSCGAQQAKPTDCPECHGHRLNSHGIGTESVRRWLERREPSLLSDSSEVLPTGRQGTWNGKEDVTSPLLEITTEGIFELPQQRDMVAFLRADSPLNAPNLVRPFRYLSAIGEAIATSTSVFVDTADATQSWLEVLQPNSHLATLLQERLEQHLPPFVRTLHLEGPIKDEAKAHAVLENLNLGHWEQSNNKIAIDVHLSPDQYEIQRTRLKRELGRGWKLKADSVLEHGFELFS